MALHSSLYCRLPLQSTAALLAAGLLFSAGSAQADDAVAAPDGKATPPVEAGDVLEKAGYIPGYRSQPSLGISPYVPTVSTLPGGNTPPFGAPTVGEDWTFSFTGSMSASLMAGISTRHHRCLLTPGVNPCAYDARDGQSNIIYHVPPRTPDEWQSFTATYPTGTNWVNLNFLYGSQSVTAQVSIDTWNPSQPTTHYQLGSQYFINNSFLKFRIPPLGGLRLQANVGYFNTSYGNLGRYGGGIYANPISGNVTGAGEVIIGEYDLSENWIGVFEHGISGPRVGKAPNNVAPSAANGNANPSWVAAWTHHAHLGVIKKGDPQFEARVHYLSNWSQDDTAQRDRDIAFTRAIDESNFPDGRITVLGADARWIHSTFGYLAGGAAFIHAKNAYPLKGLNTFAGEGDRLANVWFGSDTSGSGNLLVGAINYSASLGRIITYPDPFPGSHPDIAFDAGFQVAKSWSDDARFERTRYKGGVNALYTFSPNFGVGARYDIVVPNSKDSRETFHVIAPRLQFKSDWNSHETITLTYAKWFYGSRTRADNLVPYYQLDDQLVALNFNLWW